MSVELLTTDEHYIHLADVLMHAAAADAERRENTFSWGRKHFGVALKGCHTAMAAGVGSTGSPNSVLSFFIKRRENDWLPDVVQLWQDYRAAGMIDVHAPVSVNDVCVSLTERQAFPSGDPHPLEAAIVRGNVRFLARLLDAGAEIGMVPSRDYDSQRDLPWERRAGPVTDILSFIDCKVQEPALAQALRSVVVEHMMSREAASGMADAHTAADARSDSAAQARRARVV